MSAARYPVALFGALALTFGIFGTLKALIEVGHIPIDVQATQKIEFQRMRRDTEVEERKREKPERVKAEKAPVTPQIAQAKTTSLMDAGDMANITTQLESAAVEGAGNMSMTGGADRDVVPLVRIEPDYPMNARQRGIEGWVVVEFTISTAGTVKDAEVVASEPGTIFDKAAVQAVRKWKYNPKIKDGKPVERAGVKVRLDFEMEG
jgi:protein TonB